MKKATRKLKNKQSKSNEISRCEKADNKAVCIWILPVAFLLMIFGFAVANLFTPDREFSQSENRALAQPPVFSFESLFSGKYTETTESYITDQFVGRDSFIGIKTQADYLAGKRDSNDVYFGKDGYLFEVYTEESVDKELLQANLDRIATLAKKQEANLGKGRVYVMLVPSASEILSDKLPPLAPHFNQEAAYNSLSEKLGQEMIIDLFSALNSTEEQVFYKTDHHWTSYGAFLAYQAYCNRAGFAIPFTGEYMQEVVTSEFYGTLFTKARLFNTKPDSIRRWRSSSKPSFTLDVNMGEEEYDTLFMEEFLDKRDKYSYFLGGNNPVLTIKRQEEESNGRTLLLLKDSFAHSLAPFIAEEYDKVILLDLRYYNGSVSKLIEAQGVTDLLISYHFSTLESERGLAWLTQ